MAHSGGKVIRSFLCHDWLHEPQDHVVTSSFKPASLNPKTASCTQFLFGRFCASQKVTENGRNVFPVVHAISPWILASSYYMYYQAAWDSLHDRLSGWRPHLEDSRLPNFLAHMKGEGLRFDGRGPLAFINKTVQFLAFGIDLFVLFGLFLSSQPSELG